MPVVTVVVVVVVVVVNSPLFPLSTPRLPA
jgi:hypothetical protein